MNERAGFECDGIHYTHIKCSNCGWVKRYNVNKDYTEQDACGKCGSEMVPYNPPAKGR